jgi:hypothetical protein
MLVYYAIFFAVVATAGLIAALIERRQGRRKHESQHGK